MSFLRGGEVELRPVEAKDLAQLAAWRNEADLRQRTRCAEPLSMLDQANWFERISGPNRRDFMFVVERNGSDDTALGVVGLCHWSPRDRTAEISFYIGDPAARGKGYAKAALRLLIGYGFGELGLDRIDADVYDFNEPSKKLLDRIGFTVEGRRREAVWRLGRRCDEIQMGLLRREWSHAG